MKIDKTLHDGFAILTLKGEFDTFHCPALQQEVDALIDSGIAHLLLDMRLVKFINSTALGAMIKAHKRCRAETGELIISQPSNFVRDVVTKVGIDKLIPMFETEQEATKAIVKHLNQREMTAESSVDQATVLVTLTAAAAADLVGPGKPLVGTVSNVSGSQMSFTWNANRHGLDADRAAGLFATGASMRLKFQVKIIKKGFFEVGATVESVQTTDGSIRVTANLTEIAGHDREALDQFAADMAYLKLQLPR